MSRAQAAQKIKQSVAAPADPILLTAALDAAYDGQVVACHGAR
jgi:mono/diheme cytochrome c family protein